MKQEPAKRVNIVSLKMVRESSLLYKDRKIKSPEDAYQLLKSFLVDSDCEQLMLLTLDTKNQPTAIHTVSVGTLNSSLVHPREVMKVAILANSASIIVAHNHPSQDPSESREDVEVTRHLAEVGKILGIELIDHLIICEDKFVSLKEKGHI
ncbi:JAB domain-containing protein [Bacillus sp. DTU_2020_1000418_1_SI_GHA_SEK_038]|nr:JAB domain-containing protein [Bacillus sp. DTU_2020_1000418_1_SI_GHA_SEK_038]WNS77660.1 JAB domain-containing protein [Bacillus sp. DTU_2020_1000418_1_SI_GHA_SEK_038]